MLLTAFCRQGMLRSLNRPDSSAWRPTAILRIMQLSAIFLLACGLSLSAKTVSQTVTFSGENVSLDKVLTALKQQTDYDVVCNYALIKAAQPVTLHAVNVPIEEFIAAALAGQQMEYFIRNKTIVIQKISGGPGIVDKLLNNLKPPIKISGIVTGPGNQPLSGVTVRLKGKNRMTLTDENGHFELEGDVGSTIVISYVGFIATELKVNNEQQLNIRLVQQQKSLDTLEVTLNTGYQKIPRERATGSFAQPDKTMFASRVAPDILSKLEGITNGIVFHAPGITGARKPQISIRGRSTIFANDQPLIVVDNFPYDGDIDNINPNDVASITVLKDAAAASIWGVRAGNGVIVITTKKATLNQPLRVTVNSNVTVQDKADLYYNRNFIQSADLTGIEEFLFAQGFYDSRITDPFRPGLSDAVEILLKVRNGIITEDQAGSAIDDLHNHDIRDELTRHFYRKSVRQQHSIGLSGGNEKNAFNVSAGYDKNLSGLVGTDNDRITLNIDNNFSPFKKLAIRTGVYYTNTSQNVDNTFTRVNQFGLPYSRLTDGNGHALPLTESLATSYLQEIAGKGFLDGNFYPLEELRSGANTTKSRLHNIRINAAVTYDVTKSLSAEISYQYENGTGMQRLLSPVESSIARLQINRFSIVDTDGNVTGYRVPVGGILMTARNTLVTNNIRGQLNFSRAWSRHYVNAIAAAEQRELTGESSSDFRYGHDEKTGTFLPVDFASVFPVNPVGSGQIRNGNPVEGTTDRFRSFLANAAYTYDDRYTISVSGRVDQSNLFGVRSNQRAIPLWSVGGKWRADREMFYNIQWLPDLTVRLTYGFNGNLDKNITAITTFFYNPFPAYLTNTQYAVINSIGNNALRWEKTGMINLGIDFGLRNEIITGSIEYFRKKGVDLIGDAAMPPTSGVTTFRGNYAHMKGSGIDIRINIKRSAGDFTWNASFLFNRATDKVTEYTGTPSPAYLMNSNQNVFPWSDQPVYGVYSLRWAGLDAATGDPQGIDTTGKTSKDYAALVTPARYSDLVYNGPARPTFSGGVINSFSFKGIALSFNVNFKTGYYFRKSSLSYTNLFYYNIGHQDFESRWMKPGDEKNTHVPSMVYPINDPNRDVFYAASEIHVAKADHIRLQDISLSYDLPRNMWKKRPGSGVQIYTYMNNVGILWRANKDHLDPDYPSGGFPVPRSYAIGVKAHF